MSQQTVLITGASSGIGECFARHYAKQGAELILVARSEPQLQQLANELHEQHRVTTHYFALDLSQRGSIPTLMEQIKAKQLEVDVLINNAGFGKWNQFHLEPTDQYQQMISLNINALVELTQQLLPGMLTRQQGSIINVASTAAFQPLPYQAVYAASKAFVLHFSEALSQEYKTQGIQVMALCPGNTRSHFMQRANADTKGLKFDSPQAVVDSAIKALRKGRHYHVHGASNYWQSLLPRLLPRTLVSQITANMFRDRIAK